MKPRLTCVDKSDCNVDPQTDAGHALEIAYSPAATIAEGVRDAASRTAGNVLCFLPGAPEIYRASAAVQSVAASLQAEVVPLHGGLDSSEQDRALAPGGRRRIILATNIAETSLTVPGVSAVVDTGRGHTQADLLGGCEAGVGH